MKVKCGLIHIGFLFLFLPLLAFAQSSDSITITTYYPSPYGSYNELEVRNRLRVRGDADGDGKITHSDVAYCMRVALGYAVNDMWGFPVPAWICDINNSGIVDISDVVLLQRKVTSGADKIHNIETFFNADSTLFNGAALLVQAGNVGIGTMSPLASLHIGSGSTKINNSTRFLVSTNNPTNFIEVNNGSNNAYALFGMNNNNTALVGTVSPADLWLSTNGVAKMAVTSGGNVGIGTTSPTERLDVNGNINFTGAVMKSNAPFIQAGITTTTGTWTTVTFPQAFSSAPVITATPRITTTTWWVVIRSITATSFQIGTAGGAGIEVHWIAVAR